MTLNHIRYDYLALETLQATERDQNPKASVIVQRQMETALALSSGLTDTVAGHFAALKNADDLMIPLPESKLETSPIIHEYYEDDEEEAGILSPVDAGKFLLALL